MGIAIDIGIVLIMMLSIFIGYKKGLIKVAISFLAIIVSLVVAIIVYKPLAKQIANNTQIDEKIENTIYQKIKDTDFENITEKEKKENQIFAFTEKYVDEAINKSQENIAKYVAESLSESILEILTFVLVLIILRILLLLLNIMANVIGEIPIIKQFNKSGGIIYGIVEGFLLINVIFAVLYMINPICLNGNIKRNIDKSQLGKAVYENNLIINTIIK
ncbi:MAG: CvpA family protein [Clostridia bacterium]|jgi:uncharacterized membrane protein required for colicin V production|nr:CvpA family protein [Clostridia bacterium]